MPVTLGNARGHCQATERQGGVQWIKHENQNSLKTVVTEIDFFYVAGRRRTGLLWVIIGKIGGFK